MLLSIIIPVKGSEPYLNKLIIEIHRVLHDIEHEVIVGTEEGLGFAISCGVKRSKGDVIIIMDSDGSHSPEYLPKMLDLLLTTNTDIVIGSRFIQGGIDNDSFSRRCITHFYNKLTRFLLQINLKDPMSGFIVAKRQIFLDHPISNHFKFILPIYINPDLKIKEYPITFLPRKQGESHTSFKTGISTLLLLLTLCMKKNKESLLDFLQLPVNSLVIYILLQILINQPSNMQPLLRLLFNNPFSTFLISLEIGCFTAFNYVYKKRFKKKQQTYAVTDVPRLYQNFP